jgi:hypothetical protein
VERGYIAFLSGAHICCISRLLWLILHGYCLCFSATWMAFLLIYYIASVDIF